MCFVVLAVLVAISRYGDVTMAHSFYCWSEESLAAYALFFSFFRFFLGFYNWSEESLAANASFFSFFRSFLSWLLQLV